MTDVDTLVPVTFRVEMLARQLMRQHGLITGNKRTDWRFEWDHARRRSGRCTYPHNGQPGRITLSAPIVELWGNNGDTRDTILHEIAHALAGPEAKHGPAWRAVCVRIGARPEARFDAEDLEMPQMRYTGTCERGHTFQRRVLPPGRVRCRKDKTYITWHEN